MEFTRRQFLGSSAAAVVAAGTLARGTVFGANDRIAVCCIGVHGQGNAHIEEVGKLKGAEVVALCDVDREVLESRGKAVKERSGKQPKLFRDMREVMADESIDVITIATPNHWHSLAAVWGCQAGKDVYVEKPLSHNVWEGRQLVAAAEKHNRVVMHGTQSRVNANLIRDIGLMHDDKVIGKANHSRGYVYKTGNRKAIGFGKPAPPPANLDWTLWQGPSKDHDYLAKDDGSGLMVHYNWHWFWEYGNGEVGNQGVHEMDVACWGHNRGLPVRVYSTGGRYAWEDQGETPNTQAASFTYADGSMLTFEVRNLGSFYEGGNDACSNSFFGANGYYVRGVGFFDYANKPIEVKEPLPKSAGRFESFFNAVRSRKPEDNPAPPLAGHLSCVHIHIANISQRLGRSLKFDPKTERFVNDDEANALLKRAYREGFEVPQLA